VRAPSTSATWATRSGPSAKSPVVTTTSISSFAPTVFARRARYLPFAHPICKSDRCNIRTTPKSASVPAKVPPHLVIRSQCGSTVIAYPTAVPAIAVTIKTSPPMLIGLVCCRPRVRTAVGVLPRSEIPETSTRLRLLPHSRWSICTRP
jgi:hypothetical protein